MLDSLFGNKVETEQRDDHRGKGTEMGWKRGLLGALLGRAPLGQGLSREVGSVYLYEWVTPSCPIVYLNGVVH